MDNTDKTKVYKELLEVVEKYEDEFKRSGVASVHSIKREIERREKVGELKKRRKVELLEELKKLEEME